MKKKKTKKYFDKEWEAMEENLKNFFKSKRPEDLHQFRVQVKKLRSFMILSDKAKQSTPLAKLFKPVRKIFKQAGEIRNAYVHQELGKTQHISDHSFMSKQHALEVSATKKFVADEDTIFEKLEDAHQTIKKKVKPVKDGHINKFYRKQLEYIAHFFESPAFNDALHDCRKRIKILLYNYKLTHSVLGTGFNKKYLDGLQTVIGDWHDHILAIGLFSKNNIKDKKALANLLEQNSLLQKQVIYITNDFYGKATNDK